MPKINSRIQQIVGSTTLAITARANELTAQGKDVVNFAAGEPDFDTPDHIKEAGIKDSAVSAEIKALNALYAEITSSCNDMEKTTASIEKEGDLLAKAKVCASKGAKALESLRSGVDRVEPMVAADLWPMAKYQELLTIL